MTVLGNRIRAERLDRHLSLNDLSDRSGVSRSMLSAIERGSKVPTVLVLDHIAGALGVSVSRLLMEERKDRVVVLRAEQQEVVTEDAGWMRRIVSPVLRGIDFEMGRFEFDPGVDAGEFGTHQHGWTEYVAVEKGSLQITLNGTDVYLLGEGDALFYESDVPHAFRNPGRSKTIGYIVMNGDHRLS